MRHTARDDLGAAAMALSTWPSPRGQGRPMVLYSEIDKAESVAQRFMIRWRGESYPARRPGRRRYWDFGREHGRNASTFRPPG